VHDQLFPAVRDLVRKDFGLEPQARDGFVGWSVLDEKLRAIQASAGPKLYPVFKVRREVR
jgi:hypothetical protein